MSREEFFHGENGIDGLGRLKGDDFRETLKELLSAEALERRGSEQLSHLKFSNELAYVRCPAVLLGWMDYQDPGTSSELFTHVLPTYNVLPSKEEPYHDYEGELWLNGLISSLKSDRITSLEDASWSYHLRMEVRKSNLIGPVHCQFARFQMSALLKHPDQSQSRCA